VAEVAEKKEHPRGVARTIWVLEHTQDLVSIVVGVLLAGLAVVVLVLGVVDFFRDVTSGSPVETAVINRFAGSRRRPLSLPSGAAVAVHSAQVTMVQAAGSRGCLDRPARA
jgi:hypothetical protein